MAELKGRNRNLIITTGAFITPLSVTNKRRQMTKKGNRILEQCFINQLDLMDIYLYNTPYNNSRIYVLLNFMEHSPGQIIC